MKSAPRVVCWLVLLFSLIYLNGCSIVKAIKTVNGGQLVSTNVTPAVVPFTLTGHPILIKARINNSPKEYTFMLDTAALTIVRKEVAEELKLPQGVKVAMRGSGGNSKEIDLITLNSLRVGTQEVAQCAAGVIDMSFLNFKDVAGVIGSNFLRYFVTTIDFTNNTLILSPPRTQHAPPMGGITIPFTIDAKNGFAPAIDCVVDNEIHDTVLIDTGAPVCLIPSYMVKKTNGYKRGKTIKAIGSMSKGIGGLSEEDHAVRLDDLKIDDLLFHNVPTFSHLSKNGQLLIGNHILSRYTVTLDYPNGLMTLVPNGKPFMDNFPIYGLNLDKQDEKLLVVGYWPNSPAAKMGLKIGDEVIRLNNSKAMNFSALDLMKLFISEDTEGAIELEILRDGEKRRVVLHKENMFPPVR
ncbi:aspartyl protease family protein [Desulfogranum japonicum]|uniref:aspartyl protease family protein n=1 Tax=Desulfogranum japonicum TaxID=231447 RepID=UPI00048A4567|nr:aspartyl protease family protein [Desulfogranum japonicum]